LYLKILEKANKFHSLAAGLIIVQIRDSKVYEPAGARSFASSCRRLFIFDTIEFLKPLISRGRDLIKDRSRDCDGPSFLNALQLSSLLVMSSRARERMKGEDVRFHARKTIPEYTFARELLHALCRKKWHPVGIFEGRPTSKRCVFRVTRFGKHHCDNKTFSHPQERGESSRGKRLVSRNWTEIAHGIMDATGKSNGDFPANLLAILRSTLSRLKFERQPSSSFSFSLAVHSSGFVIS